MTEVSKFDTYLMTLVDELIKRLGPHGTGIILDLTKGSLRVPLKRRSKENTTFSTPVGLYQYTVWLF